MAISRFRCTSTANDAEKWRSPLSSNFISLANDGLIISLCLYVDLGCICIFVPSLCLNKKGGRKGMLQRAQGMKRTAESG